MRGKRRHPDHDPPPIRAPSRVQLPGGIVLDGLPFKILEHNEDGSPRTSELLPRGTPRADDPTRCVLYAHESWIRGPVR